MRKIIFSVLILLLVISIVIIVAKFGFKPKPTITVIDFESCAALGQPLMKSYPRQCRFANQTFVEDIGNELEKTDLITIDQPRPNQKISSPLIISGKARGQWFFEASFPVQLYDEQKNLLGTGIAQAQGEWMTSNFVPFALTLEFSQPQTAKGVLILRKDNPSGLPEFDDELNIPVLFE